MLYREIISVCSEIHTKHINTVCGQNVDFVDVKLVVPVPVAARSSRSAAARLLIFWVRIPPGAWMSVSCVCCVLLGRDLCDGLISHPEESYRVWCV